MDYFLLKQEASPSVGKRRTEETEDATLCRVGDIRPVRGLDYLAAECAVSERLKALLEPFLPGRAWRPHVFLAAVRQEQKAFWRPELEEWPAELARLGRDGAVSGIEAGGREVPRIFRMSPGKGTASVIIHLSIAESMLRRGILGVGLVPVAAYEERREAVLPQERRGGGPGDAGQDY